MGGAPSTRRVNFEVVKAAGIRKMPLDQPPYLVSTLAPSDQACLIARTLAPEREVSVLNGCMSGGSTDAEVIVYGRDCSDASADKKAAQLAGLGFRNVSVYGGGMFEWLLLQEIYGTAHFPTRGKERDLLKYLSAPPSAGAALRIGT